MKLISLLLAMVPVWAQIGATAQVSGSVRDNTGAVLVGATVVVRNVETGSVLSTTSDEAGSYVFPNLAPGRWEIRAEHPGFKPLVRQVELKVGQKVVLDLTLNVGEITDVVEVRGETPLVEATRIEQSQIIEQRFVTDLPISGRRFIDFVLLTPNVSLGRSYVGTSSAPQLEAQALKISFGGLREIYANNVRIDGAEATVSYTGVSRLTPSQEAVMEFRVLQGGYAAEYGRASGGIINIVTKGGTNELHGSLFYFLRNDALDARNPLRAAGGDILRQHQFGFTLGGPVLKDRLFYFGNYEGQRRKETPLYSSFVSTFLSEINRVKSALGLSREDLGVLRQNDSDQVLLRGDYIRGRLTLNGRYDFNEQRNRNQPATIEGQGLPSNFRHNEIRDQSVVLGVTSLLMASLTNESLFNFVHRTFANPPVSFEPGIQIINTADMGRHAGPFDFYRERRFQVADTVSYVWGQHITKFGVDINHVRNRVVFSGFNPAIALFTVESFFGLPPFSRPTALLFVAAIPSDQRVDPLPRRDFSRLFPNSEWEAAATIRPSLTFFEAFGQDQVRLWNKLTLNFGIRYGVETRPYGIVSADRNNVQPRLGFAYAFNSRTVLRGGGGIYVGPMPWSEILGYLTPWGGIDFPDPQLRLTPVPFRLGALGPLPGPFTAGVAFSNFVRTGAYPSVGSMSHWILIKPVRDFPNPYAEQAIVQIERELGQHWGITMGYIFVHGLKMGALRHVNARPIGVLPNGKRQYTLRDLRFVFYQVMEPTQTSLYHAGNLILQKRMSHHVSFIAHYTFSKTIDSTSPAVSLIQIPEDPLNARLDRAVSQQHVGHRFVLSGVLEGPAGFLLTRGFKLSTILTLESPRFYTLYAGFDANGDGEPSNDRVGLLGRNTLKGDRFASVDLRLSRTVKLAERIGAEFIAEAFNLFNTFNIQDFDTVYGRADFPPGVPAPRSYRERVPSPNPAFLTPRSIGNARQIQFAVRVTF